MKALITGIFGFQGRHLAQYLCQEGHTVYGFNRKGVSAEKELKEARKVYIGDITSAEDINHAVSCIKPDVIFHLAALISGRNDKTTLDSLMHTNATGTIKLLEASRSYAADPIIINIGSSAEYGNIPIELQPITEDNIYQPMNYYAISKITQEMVALQAWHAHQQKVVRACVFNIIGPGQPHNMVPATFARQIAEIEQKQKLGVLKVGNLDVYRDITDVRDIVKAYYQLAKHGRAGEKYNICSGQASSIRNMLEQLIGLSGASITVTEENSRLRKTDIVSQKGSMEKLRKLTTWHPSISMQQSLKDILDEQRQLVQ